MRKLVTNNRIVNLVIGILLVAAAILTIVFQNDITEIMRYIFAGLIIIYALLRFVKEIKLYKHQTAKVIVGVELSLVIIIAILLIVVDWLNIAMALGVVIYVRGAIFLLIQNVIRRIIPLLRFLLNIVFITGGSYLIFVQPDAMTFFIWFLVVILLVVAAIFIIYAIQQFKDLPKKEKPAPEPEISTEKPVTPQPSKKPETKTYTKKALMEKSVDDLKAMCKTRGLSGYSNLRKEALVEKLWLYEHES